MLQQSNKSYSLVCTLHIQFWRLFLYQNETKHSNSVRREYACVPEQIWRSAEVATYCEPISFITHTYKQQCCNQTDYCNVELGLKLDQPQSPAAFIATNTTFRLRIWITAGSIFGALCLITMLGFAYVYWRFYRKRDQNNSTVNYDRVSYVNDVQYQDVSS